MKALVENQLFPSIEHQGRNSKKYTVISIAEQDILKETQQIPAMGKKVIHQVTTMLGTSKYVLFKGHNHLLTTNIDD